MSPRVRRQTSQSAADRRDFHLGILISIGAGLFLITLLCEFTGQPALLWAVLTGLVAVIVAVLWRRRSRR
jgi:Flp pilus assembly protein TadB